VDGGATRLNNLGHLQRLFETMRSLELTRVHISFCQRTIGRARSHLSKIEASKGIKVYDLRPNEQVVVFDTYMAPYLGGIRAETCTARDLVIQRPEFVSLGACTGQADIESIVGHRLPPARPDSGMKDRGCMYYTKQDVGKGGKCAHGLRLLFCGQQLVTPNTHTHTQSEITCFVPFHYIHVCVSSSLPAVSCQSLAKLATALVAMAHVLQASLKARSLH
jgi:hypothetical protein